MPVRRNAPQRALPEQLDLHVLQHIQRLGLANVKAYRQWCVDHGFSRGLNKHHTIRAAELAAARQPNPVRVAQRHKESKHPLTVLREICDGHLRVDDLDKPHLRSFAKRCNEALHSKSEPCLKKAVLSKLVRHLIASRAKFLNNCNSANAIGESNPLLEALIRVAQHQRSWIREIESWKPRSHSPRRQFISLLRHLFVKYDDMPEFFDAAWLEQDPASGPGYRQWYAKVGSGQSLRSCDLPIDYTRRMAHHFMHAPNDLTINHALRYGQVLGLGGDERIARAIAATRLADHFEHDKFWSTVICWVIAQSMLDLQHIGPIVDYIHNQRFVPEHVLIYANRNADARNAGQQGALAAIQPEVPQPNFTIRGRTPETLLRQVADWHGRLSRDNRQQVRVWLPSLIDPLEFVEGFDGTQHAKAGRNFKKWTIRELLSSQALVAEGRALNHCVATYARSCAARQTSIWTLELETADGISKLLTIEVNLRIHSIVQIRGKSNRLPSQSEKIVIQRWASSSRLSISRVLSI